MCPIPENTYTYFQEIILSTQTSHKKTADVAYPSHLPSAPQGPTTSQEWVSHTHTRPRS